MIAVLLTEATQIITSVLSLVTGIITWAGPWVNPLDADATFITWLIDLAVVGPIGFSTFKRLLGLVSG